MDYQIVGELSALIEPRDCATETRRLRTALQSLEKTECAVGGVIIVVKLLELKLLPVKFFFQRGQCRDLRVFCAMFSRSGLELFPAQL